MSILKPINKAKYNTEPVSYCSTCLSLMIMVEKEVCYCGKCGDIDINEDLIENWEVLYHDKYKKNHLNNNNSESK